MKDYLALCNCGTQIIARVNDECTSLEIFCNRCNLKILSNTNNNANTGKKEKTLSIENHSSFMKANKPIQKIGDYNIIELLGKGGMGSVYLGVHETTQEKVAVKLLNLDPNDPSLVNYFLREISLLTQLNHKNIVKFKDKGTYEDTLYLVMEYIEGRSLDSFIQKTPLQARHALQIAYYVLEALEYAQKYSFVHRDIKPENILIETLTKVIKVVDLGIGKILGDSNALSKTGFVIGTPFYMAPEQIADSKHVDPRADLYSVGATLYHMLAGTPPYSELDINLVAILYGKLNHEPVPLIQKSPDLSPEIIQITEKAMARDINKRYQSATEMKTDILHFCTRCNIKLRVSNQNNENELC